MIRNSIISLLVTVWESNHAHDLHEGMHSRDCKKRYTMWFISFGKLLLLTWITKMHSELYTVSIGYPELNGTLTGCWLLIHNNFYFLNRPGPVCIFGVRSLHNIPLRGANVKFLHELLWEHAGKEFCEPIPAGMSEQANWFLNIKHAISCNIWQENITEICKLILHIITHHIWMIFVENVRNQHSCHFSTVFPFVPP